MFPKHVTMKMAHGKKTPQASMEGCIRKAPVVWIRQAHMGNDLLNVLACQNSVFVHSLQSGGDYPFRLSLPLPLPVPLPCGRKFIMVSNLPAIGL